MARIIRSDHAENDSVEIWVHVAQHSPAAADKILDTFEEVFTRLSQHSHLGKYLDNFAGTLRVFPTGSYLIFYRPITDGVEIVRVLHEARDITQEFFDEA